MRCKKCGQEIKQGAVFCVKCGTSIHPEHSSGASGKNSIMLICVSIVVVLVLGGIGFAGYKTFSSRKKDDSINLAEATEYESEENTEIDSTEIADTDEEPESEVQTEEDVEIAADTEEMSEEPVALMEEEPVEEEKPHTYQIVVKDVTWTEAYYEAKNVPNGYLVNIDTEEEWNAILQQIQAEQKEECIFWIGALRNSDSEDYYWVDAEGYSVGEPINESSRWLSGEPTFYDAENEMDEYYVDMFFSKSENRWVWNDTPDDLISLLSYYSGKLAYIVEIENE